MTPCHASDILNTAAACFSPQLGVELPPFLTESMTSGPFRASWNSEPNVAAADFQTNLVRLCHV